VRVPKPAPPTLPLVAAALQGERSGAVAQAHRRRHLFLVWLAVIAVAAAGLAAAAWTSRLLDAPERLALDARFSLRGTQRPGNRIAIVAIDEDAVAQFGWPFARRLYAPLIRLLQRDRARLIVFDLGFDSVRPGDGALLAAARAAAPVVFAAGVISPSGDYLVLGGPSTLHAVGARVGSPFVLADPDGVLRHMPASYRHVPSLPVVAAQLLGVRVDRSLFTGAGALIDYAGSAGTFPTYRFARALAGAVRPASLAGRVVLVGATAAIIEDRHATPFGEMPGPEVAANELRTVMLGVPLQPVRGLVTWLLIALLAAVPAAVGALRRSLLLVAGGTLLAAFGYLLASQLAFDSGAVTDVSAPLLAVLLSGAAVIVLGSVGADRERQRLRQQFAAFAPDLVDAVLAGEHVPLAATGVIGGYRVEALIGRGGMAAVYRATQLVLDRPVALKLIAAAAAHEPVYRERFLRESRLAATVEHPSVIPIYEAGDDAGLLFIAMRYVDGVDLDALLRRLGPLPPADAVRVVGQVAGALDAAHARGLVHRDVKPGNVLLDVDLEHAYLADFGVAGLAGARTALTMVGGFIGTANYAAPEQAAGVEVDRRADIYALGGLLFHALTGRLPYERDSPAAMIAAHASAPVPGPSEVNEALAAFDPVIVRAMAKRPEERFATARELATAAREALEAVPARPD